MAALARLAKCYILTRDSSSHMDASALERFLTNYKSITSTENRLNETDTRNMIVNPFLMALGWNFVPEEIQSEFPVQVGGGTQYADYCLKVNGSRVAFLESKSFGSPLDERDFDQVLAYGRVKFVRWCMITNGVEWVVLDSQNQTDSASDTEVFRFRFVEMRDSSHYLEAISKEGLERGLLESLADEIYERRTLLARFTQKRDEFKQRILDLIAEVHLEEELANQVAERFLTQVRTALEGGVRPPDGGGGDGNGGGGGGGPIGEKYAPMRRTNLPGPDSSLVAVFPSRPDGEEFLRKFNAWGFVSLRGNPRFCAIYFTKPEQSIRIVASISRIIPASAWLAANKDKATERDFESYDPDKSVIEFKPKEAWELEDPVPWEKGDPVIYGLRYTSLGDLRRASRIGDLRTPGHR